MPLVNLRFRTRGFSKPQPHKMKKVSTYCTDLSILQRRRDSNPRYLAVQRFSRPPHSTTLPRLCDLCISSVALATILTLSSGGSAAFDPQWNWTLPRLCDLCLPSDRSLIFDLSTEALAKAENRIAKVAVFIKHTNSIHSKNGAIDFCIRSGIFTGRPVSIFMKASTVSPVLINLSSSFRIS